ncbi:hypothetical protein ACFORL_04940 [Legionella dresdenensis]|uniref:Uncharacterized protein n=1 Tax=Legionella dresdenensis TaxID=450200 RepID=A0ABV8CEE8_9GAMM
MGVKQNLIYNTIDTLASQQDSYACIRLMLQYRIGDCGDQATYLSALLANTAYIAKRYRVFYAAFESELVNHGFVLIIPRLNKLLQSDIFQNDSDAITVDAKLFLDNEAIIVADPWQNKIFPKGISKTNNPFNFTSKASISEQKWILRELKTSFLFQHLQLHCIDALIESLDCIDRKMKQEIRDTCNYHEALINSAAQPNQIELTRILLSNILFIRMPTILDDVLEQAKAAAKLANNLIGLELINAFVAQRALEKIDEKNNSARVGFFDNGVVDESYSRKWCMPN